MLNVRYGFQKDCKAAEQGHDGFCLAVQNGLQLVDETVWILV